jgi:hypothetical protein
MLDRGNGLAILAERRFHEQERGIEVGFAGIECGSYADFHGLHFLSSFAGLEGSIDSNSEAPARSLRHNARVLCARAVRGLAGLATSRADLNPAPYSARE